MIKNCKVLINNEAVTVIDYDGVEVQIPSIKRNAQTVKVKKTINGYAVVDEDFIESETLTSEKSKKKNNKKATSLESDYVVIDDSEV